MSEKIQIIPAILETDFDAIVKKAAVAKTLSPITQLDVMDGIFVPNTTFSDPQKIAEIDCTFELHLMITKPEMFVAQWDIPNVQRMIVHYEAVANLQHVIDQIKKMDKEVGIALNPGTPSHALEDVIDQIDMVLVMGVQPGFAGQKFEYDVLEKMKELKGMRSDIVIAVDGGVNMRTRDRVIEAGAKVLTVNSVIWGSTDVAAAYNELLTGVKAAATE
jgi:ribulose-phosphate 3-epimerase